ncbi:uncharacterized protein Z518_09336 [Rhinocladiella mackenziei CBS 650.93]|uniref:Uncharacterized protein n=1 Tax=Rhinocladiella mackenziei CBS 650.93 TaxID=1442369 RepID=A0A0D2IYE5_9EURO|nr:uncharacterized protein Z518_09336 [Rhinocladiella mackenziei CBS 650.93]KIX01610.1 hypothetical protein Z518_09336 [Rhinocladiella mackenziei CBS 650.93]
MSLGNSPDCLFRPEDEVLKMLFPTSIEESNSLDDVFNEDMYRLDGSDEENKEQFEELFGSDTVPKDQFHLPSLDASAKNSHSPPQPWRQGVWCLKQRQQSAGLAVEKTRKPETKLIEPIQTMNTVNHQIQTTPIPVSPLEFTSFSRTKRFATPSTTGGFPEMRTSVMARNQRIGIPASGCQDDNVDTDYSSAIDPLLLNSHGQGHQDTMLNYSQDSLLSQHQQSAHGQATVPSPPSGNPPSSSSSNHSRDVRTHTSDTNRDIHSQALYSLPTMNRHPPLPTLAPEETYPALAAPTPQRMPHQILHQPMDPRLSRLGIRYPESEQMSQAVLFEPQTYLRRGATIAVPYPSTTVAAPGGMSPYPPLPPPPSHVFSESSPFITPPKQRRSPFRSPSFSKSPTNISARRHAQRSPTRTVTDYSHSGRKSIHKSGPIRDSGVQEPLPVPRTRSASRPPRTPKTPKTPTGGGPVMDFVNFTPKDSAKLLSDVAPSGSSKTRARREMEAREKRKKLSEAALKAVKVAGGDVAAFEKAIFT